MATFTSTLLRITMCVLVFGAVLAEPAAAQTTHDDAAANEDSPIEDAPIELETPEDEHIPEHNIEPGDCWIAPDETGLNAQWHSVLTAERYELSFTTDGVTWYLVPDGLQGQDFPAWSGLPAVSRSQPRPRRSRARSRPTDSVPTSHGRRHCLRTQPRFATKIAIAKLYEAAGSMQQPRPGPSSLSSARPKSRSDYAAPAALLRPGTPVGDSTQNSLSARSWAACNRSQ
jgi:hypothetical protein